PERGWAKTSRSYIKNEQFQLGVARFFIYVTFSPSRSVRCVTNKPPAMRVRDEGYTKKTPNAIQ
ncbi:TPA: hypothetical protein ACIQO1_002053, partial [Streptococcus suis]